MCNVYTIYATYILYTHNILILIYKVETYIIVWLARMDDWLSLSPWFLLNDSHRHHQQQLHHYHRRGSQSQT